MVAPESAMLEGAVVVNVPPQVAAVALATVTPAGKVSVTATPVNGTAFAAGLTIVNVRVVVWPGLTAAGLNATVSEGGATTVIDAEAVPPVPASLETSADVVFAFRPAEVPVTFTENAQDAPAASVPP